MIEPALLPPLACPFCSASLQVGRTGWWYHPKNDCLMSAFRCKDATVAAWNKRPPPSEEEIERAAIAMDRAEIGYSIKLVKLVDGIATYALEYNDGSPVLEFPGHEEAYEHVRARQRIAKARAALAAGRGA